MSQDNSTNHTWPMVPLGAVARELSVRSNEAEHLPILSVTKHRGFVPSLDYFKKQVFSRDTRNYKLVKGGQFAYATIHLDEGSIDYLRKFEAGLISPMYTVFDVDRSRVDPAYLLRVLKSPEMLKRYGALGQGSVNRRKSIGFSQLAKLEIPLPSLYQQYRIAQALAAVDSNIQISEDLTRQLETLKRGIIKGLLSHGIAKYHQDYVETILGNLPKGWEVVELSTIAIAKQGYTFKPKYQGNSSGTWMFIKVLDMELPGNEIYIQKSSNYIDNKVVEELKISPFPVGTILFPRVGGALRTNKKRILKNCAFIDDNSMTLRVKSDKVIAEYLFRWIEQVPLTAFANENALPSINSKNLYKALVPLPPVKEQKEIAEILSTFDDRIRVERERIAQLKVVQRGLVQQLLNGEFELPLEPEEVPV